LYTHTKKRNDEKGEMRERERGREGEKNRKKEQSYDTVSHLKRVCFITEAEEMLALESQRITTSKENTFILKTFI